MLFNIKYSVNEIKRFHAGVLPLLHSLSTRFGFPISAPVSVYLDDFLGHDLYQRTRKLDEALRFRGRQEALDYLELMELYYAMLSMLHYGITHYQEFEICYRNPPEKIIFSQTYFNMVLARLVNRSHYISELIKLRSNPKVDVYSLEREILEAFKDVDLDYALVDVVLTKGDPYYQATASPKVLYAIYKTIIELKIDKKTELKSDDHFKTEKATIHRIVELARVEVLKMKDSVKEMHLMVLESMVAFQVDNDAKKAIELIVKAQALLEKNYEASSEEYHSIKSEMLAQHAYIFGSDILNQGEHRNLATLREGFALALTVKPTLPMATAGIKERLFYISLKLVKAFVENISQQLKMVTPEKCEALQNTILEATGYLRFLKSLDCPKIHTELIVDSEEIQKNLSSFMKTLREKQDSFLQAKLADEKKQSELAAKQRESDQAFEALMKGFQKKCTVKIKERTNKLPVQSAPKRVDLPEPSQPAPVQGSPEVLTVSKRWKNFFHRHSVCDCEQFIAAEDDNNKAEAMLYVGDKFLCIPNVEWALYWYEEAIKTFNQQTDANPEISASIQIMLKITQKLLNQQLALSIQRQKDLEAELYYKIINWGIDVCRAKGASPQLLGMRDEQSVAIIYEAGWNEYLRLGRQNKQAGRMPSAKTFEKQAIEMSQEVIREQLEKTNTLMHSIKPAVVIKPEDFPPLNANPALMFAEKGKPKCENKRSNKSIRQGL